MKYPKIFLCIMLVINFISAAESTIKELPLETIKILGKKMYFKDVFNTKATDILLEDRSTKKKRKNVAGWINYNGDGTTNVAFVSEEGKKCKIQVLIKFKTWEDYSLEMPEDEYLSPAVDQMFKARQKAIKNIGDFCSHTVNTIVIDDVDDEIYYVYAMSTTTTPGVVVGGIHYRFMIRKFDLELLNKDQLTKSCFELPKPQPKPGEDPQGMIMTHLVSSTPVETHIFNSYLHKTPIYVGIDKDNLWVVYGSEIKKVDMDKVKEE